MSVATYTKAGTKASVAAKLSKKVFEAEVKNHDLLKRAYLTYLANGRENLSVVKTRGLVRGGGRKPWRQKGTGRARFGSSRVPIWRGGGITFGPTGEENYSLKLPVNVKRQALRQALTTANKAGKIKVIDDLANLDGKTKEIVKLLDKIEATGAVLAVVEARNGAKEKAVRNIPNLKLVSAKFLSTYDVLNADSIIISQKALAVIENWLGDTKPAKMEAKNE